ncbi:DUF2971 domain-containing protein [Ruminiclostridium cellulolyticum]|uniref:DUF2971 domain-containing protein n=1 Tax=Ruminiclostridium cellulolyticum (strain ATCC 35319 / DSM 5812 / JCM 6584 / H10) TaxID=394503 RepID=B8I1B1_RUMCH|nr:DUF2971 domain-containing protein [Ruminiclostridium cellulolyticum]ACL75709.1 hypothetical protein Ccel_1355 [Ruminiclostridium cellulolyticum H10]
MKDQKLWRYYDLIKFLTLINGELYFARADSFKDKYEGAIPKQTFQSLIEVYKNYGTAKNETDIRLEFQNVFNEKRKKASISCWHINDTESAAMWELYSKAGFGIAVNTTIDRLTNSLVIPHGYKMVMSEVNYIDFETENDINYIYNELLPFKNKRKEFIYENEFRVILYKEKKESETVSGLSDENVLAGEVSRRFHFRLENLPAEGIKVKVDPSEIILEILASPHMKKYEVREIQRLLDIINKNNNTNFIMQHSNIYDNLNYSK